MQNTKVLKSEEATHMRRERTKKLETPITNENGLMYYGQYVVVTPDMILLTVEALYKPRQREQQQRKFFTQVEQSRRQLQALVDGYFEQLPQSWVPSKYVFYVHDEGRIVGLPINRLVTLMLGHLVVGNVVIAKRNTPYADGLLPSEIEAFHRDIIKPINANAKIVTATDEELGLMINDVIECECKEYAEKMRVLPTPGQAIVARQPDRSYQSVKHAGTASDKRSK